MRSVISNWFLVFLFCWSLPLLGQHNNFKTYSLEDGLTQSTIYKVIQDARGYLWLGTEGGGVFRFDGGSFESFNKKEGLAGNVVRALLEDSRGNIWIGTDEGISIYNGIRFSSFGEREGVPLSQIMCFVEDSQGFIWAGSAGSGIIKMKLINPDSISTIQYKSEDGLSDFVFDLHLADNGKIWAATFGGGINLIKPNKDEITVRSINRRDGIPSDKILSITEDHDGNIWGGTLDAGAFKLVVQGEDSGSVSNYNLINGINDNRVWSIICDSEGVMWFGTDEGGINKYQDGKFSAYTVKNGLANNQVLCVYEDIDGIIWSGTMGSGICKFNGYHFSHYSEDDGLSNNSVSGIVQDSFGNYWIASWNGLTQINFIDGELISNTYTIEDGLVNNKIKSIAKDHEGNIWLATESGISQIVPDKMNPYINLDSKPKLDIVNYSLNDAVNCIFIGRDGRIWCGTRGGLSLMLGPDAFIGISPFFEEQELNSEVQAIIQSHDSTIWFGTLGCLAKTDRRSMTTYDEEEGLYDKKVHCLAEDVKGNIWIGTFGGGLYKMDVHTEDSMQVSFIADDNILSSNNIYSMIFLDKNTLLIGTENGFDKIYLDDNQNFLKIKSYKKSDGFIGIENNLNSIYKDDEGNIWFGTVKGITKYSPALEKINLNAPRTNITGIDLFYEKVAWDTRTDEIEPWSKLPENLVLPYSDNHLTFNYTGISLSNPEMVSYKYKLEGLETEWSPARKQTEAIYSGLKPGEYTFNVIAVNENGVWNKEPSRYHFVIMPPFWQTWWFYLLCSLVALVSIIGFVKVRERNLLHEKAILEQKVKERTSELAEKNKEITDSINYAQNIQRAILPAITSIEKGFEDSFVLFRPRDIVSGDFYWYTSKKGKSFIAACDCTGHGVPGAFVSMIGNNILNQLILEKNIEHPGEILTKLNQGVKFAFTQEGEQEAQDGMDMALIVIDKEKGVLEVGGAYNPLILIRDDDLEVIKVDRASIGGDTSFDFQFENFKFDIKEGDRFYLFSDGFPDQFGGAKGKKFMMKRFKEMLLKNHKLPMADQNKVYQESFLNWIGTQYDQIDDVLLIGIKV